MKMGTTTFYLRHNDGRTSLRRLRKKDLEKLDSLSPFAEENSAFGWRAPLELHNGNVYLLVFWEGRLMKLEDAPKILNKKYYNKRSRRVINKYEWTLLKRHMLNSALLLDKEFKKELRKRKQSQST